MSVVYFHVCVYSYGDVFIALWLSIHFSNSGLLSTCLINLVSKSPLYNAFVVIIA